MKLAFLFLIASVLKWRIYIITLWFGATALFCAKGPSGFTHHCSCTISANVNTVKKANDFLVLLQKQIWPWRASEAHPGTPRGLQTTPWKPVQKASIKLTGLWCFWDSGKTHRDLRPMMTWKYCWLTDLSSVFHKHSQYWHLTVVLFVKISLYFKATWLQLIWTGQWKIFFERNYVLHGRK